MEMMNWYEKAHLGDVDDYEVNEYYETFLIQTDWLVIRHRDELDLGIETSLTELEFRDLLNERKNARKCIG